MQVEQLSKEAQEVITKYTQEGPELLARYAALSSVLGVQPWATPAIEDYQLLAKARGILLLVAQACNRIASPQAACCGGLQCF
jgi:hypothetical protein